MTKRSKNTMSKNENALVHAPLSDNCPMQRRKREHGSWLASRRGLSTCAECDGRGVSVAPLGMCRGQEFTSASEDTMPNLG